MKLEFFRKLATLDLTGLEFRIVLLLVERETYSGDIAYSLGISKQYCGRLIVGLVEKNILLRTKVIGNMKLYTCNKDYINNL